MSSDNGDGRAPVTGSGSIPEDVAKRLAARSEAIATALNRKGLPTTWGTGRPRPDVKPPAISGKRRKRTG